MASNLYETLKNIENGRQNCIKNARLANLPANQNMNIYDIGELFLQKNTDTPITYDNWIRPEDWWDTKTILNNASVIEKDGLTYYPAYIMLINDAFDTLEVTKSVEDKATQGDAFVFSDEPELLYVGDTIHTWDKTKDKVGSVSYNTRYVLVYVLDKQLTGTISLNKDFPCAEVILGEVSTLKDGTLHSTITNPSGRSIPFQFVSNIFLENFETQLNTDCSQSTYFYNSFYKNRSLKHVLLNNVITMFCNSTTNQGNLYYCNALINLEIPDLEVIISPSLSFYYIGIYELYAPKLKIMYIGQSFCSGASRLKKINFPLLERVIFTTTSTSTTNAFLNSSYLEEVNLPSLEYVGTELGASSNGSMAFMYMGYNLKEIILPRLKEMYVTYFIRTTPLLQRIVMPNLEHFISWMYPLDGIQSLETLITPEGVNLESKVNSSTTYAVKSDFLKKIHLYSKNLALRALDGDLIIPENFIDYTLYVTSLNLYTARVSIPVGFRGNLYLGYSSTSSADSASGIDKFSWLPKSDLLKIIDNLADVNGAAETHTLKINPVLKENLTDEELAVATNKGWTIA